MRGVWRATVVTVSPVRVVAPRLREGRLPVELVTEQCLPLTEGQRVLVALLEGRADDLVIVGTLP